MDLRLAVSSVKQALLLEFAICRSENQTNLSILIHFNLLFFSA